VKDKDNNELKLENNTIMSAKDLCALPFIEQLKEAGITAFKIEGRNREPEYVDAVTRVYRKAIDKNLTKEEIQNSMNELKKVYNKGHSPGFFLKSPTSDDFSKTEHSSATQKKQFIGKITHYYSKLKVGSLHINAGYIKLGDELFIIGKKTGFIRHKIKSMQIKHKNVKSARKSQDVGIKLPTCKKGDEVYKIVKR